MADVTRWNLNTNQHKSNILLKYFKRKQPILISTNCYLGLCSLSWLIV